MVATCVHRTQAAYTFCQRLCRASAHNKTVVQPHNMPHPCSSGAIYVQRHQYLVQLVLNDLAGKPNYYPDFAFEDMTARHDRPASHARRATQMQRRIMD
eukprot:3354512-Karenia_brevis.AAC.2